MENFGKFFKLVGQLIYFLSRIIDYLDRVWPYNYFGLTLNYNRTYNKILQNIKVLMTVHFIRKQRLFI